MTEDSNPTGPGAKRFGRYLLLEAIDRGGMADVYRAVSRGPGGFQRQFVIKRIRKEKAASRDFVEMFINEARISALLEHPNIVQVYDFGQVDGDYFLAMEYLRGRNLQTVARRLHKTRQTVPADVTAYVGREVARGLHYAHTLSNMGEPLGIVHRDVSPSNIMLLKTGGVKLLDFGIARATMKLRSLTPIGGLIKGKLSYLSPEQVKGGGGIDGRSDIFSLGVVLWEALTGLRLFFNANDLETMRNVLHRVVPKPSEMAPNVPPALDAIVCKALERDRDKRFPDANALANELDEYLREVRFSPESVVQLMGDLFAGEETGRELPLPTEAPPPARKSASRSAISNSSGSIPPPALPEPIPPQPAPAEEDQGYATVSEVHRLAAIANRIRRKRMMQVATASAALTALAVFGISASKRGGQSTGTPHAAVISPGPAFKTTPAAIEPAGGTATAPGSARPGPEITPLPANEVPAPAVAAPPAVEPTPAPAAATPEPARGARKTVALLDKSRARRPEPAPAAAPAAPGATKTKRALATGLEAIQSGEYMRAIAQLEDAAQAAPHSAEPFAALAEAEFELAQYARALNHASRAASLAPTNVRYQALLGDAFFKLRRFREAALAYTAALALAPSDQSLQDRKARAEVMIGTREEVPPGEDPKTE